MTKDTIPFEQQLEIHSPVLNSGVVTFLEQMDMLGFVDSQQDPRQPVQDIIVEDKLVALGAAYKQLAKTKPLRDSISILDEGQANGTVEEVVPKAGRLLIDKNAKSTNPPEAVEEAIVWVTGVLGAKANLKAYHKLFDKALAKDEKAKAKNKTRHSNDVVTAPVLDEESAPKPKSELVAEPQPQLSIVPEVIKPQSLAPSPNNRHHIERDRRKSEQAAARAIGVFVNQLTSYIDGRTAHGEVRFKQITHEVAEALEIPLESAKEAVANAIAGSEILQINRSGGHKKIGRANSAMDELIPGTIQPSDVVISPKTQEVLLDIDDFQAVVDILTIVRDNQYANQGSTSRAIDLAMREKGYDMDASKIKSLIRSICNMSNGLVFEKRGRKSKGPKLYFKTAEDKQQFDDNPKAYTEGIFDKALFERVAA